MIKVSVKTVAKLFYYNFTLHVCSVIRDSTSQCRMCYPLLLNIKDGSHSSLCQTVDELS